MILELLKMGSVSPTFIYTLVCLMASTKVFRAAASFAYDRKRNKITVENLRLTKLIQVAAPLFWVFGYALFKVIV